MLYTYLFSPLSIVLLSDLPLRSRWLPLPPLARLLLVATLQSSTLSWWLLLRFSFRLLPLELSSSLTPLLATDDDDDVIAPATVAPCDDLPVPVDECFDLSRDFERLRSRCSCFNGSTGINLDGDSGAFALCGVDESANNGFSCGRKLKATLSEHVSKCQSKLWTDRGDSCVRMHQLGTSRLHLFVLWRILSWDMTS